MSAGPRSATKHDQEDRASFSMSPNKRESAANHQHTSSCSSVSQDDYSTDGESYAELPEALANTTDPQTTLLAYTTHTATAEQSDICDEDEKWASAPIDLPACMTNSEIWHLLAKAPANPPVTPETLKELDLQWIQNNINLRVDVHHDYDLHFMPISGRRGEEKRTEAQLFWGAVELEMRIHQHNCSMACLVCSRQPAGATFLTFKQRLPLMFSKLKALLLILVPNDDRQRVLDALDVTLLVQQLKNGVLDAIQLSRWLSDLLTTHCAPIRDEWADEMKSMVSEGVQQNDLSSLMAGLEKLFSFCEAMKLDVANHQIRTLRLPLIEDGIAFQRDYFRTRIRLGKLNLEPSLQWFGRMYQACFSTRPTNFDQTPIAHGLVRLAVRTNEEIPELLRYDSSRIFQLREELSDFVHLEICCDYLSSRLKGQSHHSRMQTLKTRLLDLTDGECTHAAGSDAIWNTHLDALSAEITRATYAALRPSTVSIPATAFARDNRNLSAQFHQVEGRLDKFAEGLQEMVLKHTSSFQQLSALQISEMQQHHQQSRQNGACGRHVPDIDDIARRLAHMTVIHWRVWYDSYFPVMESIATGVADGDLHNSSLRAGSGNGQ